MAKIIREKYENGVLVSREIEHRGVSYLRVVKLLIHLVIAVSVAIIAALNLTDGPNFQDIPGHAGINSGACPRPNTTL
jgi:hypothetical protein